MRIKDRIEICGNIASGKTTLAQAFQSYDIQPIYEDFKCIAFLDDFYKEPEAFSFETELSFTLQHYYQIKKQDNLSICDFSLITDYAFALTTLKNNDMDAYNAVFSVIVNKIGLPQRIIRLTTSNDELSKRIKNRGRSNEMSITREYLSVVDKNIEFALKKFYHKIEIAVVNTETIDSSRYDDSFLKKLIGVQ